MNLSQDLQRFFEIDNNSVGAKGLVFIGDEVLVYRRDHNTNNHPGELDLPGGGPMPDETPFENFQREVKEEFDITINQNDIVYVRCYPSSLDPKRTAYYPVAKLAANVKSQIKLGDEGQEWLLMPFDEYLERADAWKIFQDRAREYAHTSA